MIAAAEIGVNVGVTPEAVAERVIACTLGYGPLPKPRVAISSVLRALALDKKAEHSTPRFVLLDAIGSTLIRGDVPAEVIKSAVRSVIA